MIRKSSPWAAAALLTFSLIEPLSAHKGKDDESLEEVVVEGRRQVLAGEARTASEGIIGQEDLRNRPLRRPGDVLESIPGLIVTQHSGSGKSNQMFLRGFNLDHGTDFATWIDGMPVNMRSHGHGQGYTDINFLIPETIRAVEFVKGPYHAELGDFSSAGGARISTFDRLPANQLRLGLGENGFGRVLAMGGSELAGGYLSGALEGQVYDGPWTDIEEDVEKVNGLLRYTRGDDVSRWSVSGMFYDNSWNSADQIPQRAVQQGLIDELGSIDRSLGGTTRRASLSWQYSHEHESHRSEWNAYLIDYSMELWSNFTYLLEDPENGDQFEQFDERRIYGLNWNRFWVTGAGEHFHHSLGAEFRFDDISDVGLANSRNRKRQSIVRQDAVDQVSVGAHYELAWHFAPDWRAVLGVRGDFYWFDVDSDLADNSGRESDGIVSPKASLIHSLSDHAELFLSGGFGFHSNDARGATIAIDPGSGEAVAPVDPLVQSRGAELGLKALWLQSWNTSLALWYLELDSELLFVGDAGTTEPSRPSRRWGVEFNNFWSLNEIWTIEADFAWTNARFDDSDPDGAGNRIPGALPFVATGAITAEYPSGWFGQFRIRHFAAFPLIEDNSVESDGSTIANLALGWSNERWRVQLDVLNLFDSADHDIDYFYASRLPAEPAAGVEDIHYHVFEPRQARLHLSYRF